MLKKSPFPEADPGSSPRLRWERFYETLPFGELSQPARFAKANRAGGP